ncbi:MULTISPECIES: 3-oxoacid CoA-transferase subunit A [unclassified Mycobacterium]|uniref:3-oxoacid CoA-transferase subunit A n=1 Tax=unclassified Mycobacterium TaxID=2642494 RepID=UPI0029C66643|nr:MULTISPECIES: 3-oxoacid CoA-transferase subunit A [unclassified Mycobacterium]
MIDKRCADVDEALAGVGHGTVLMIGGFGEVGVPDRLIDGLLDRHVRELTVIANNAGAGEHGLAALIREGAVARIICSYPRSPGSIWFERAYAAGTIELELVPQGTLTERIRAGGAGIPAFYTAVGVGTDIARGRETAVFDGREYLLERALTADVALLRARSADRWGNLCYHATARNFAPTMAAAATLTVVQAEEIVELGKLDPEEIVTPGVYVDRVLGPGDGA